LLNLFIAAAALSAGFILGGIIASGKISELEERLQHNDKFVAELSRELRECKLLLGSETPDNCPAETIDVKFEVVKRA